MNNLYISKKEYNKWYLQTKKRARESHKILKEINEFQYTFIEIMQMNT